MCIVYYIVYTVYRGLKHIAGCLIPCDIIVYHKTTLG